MFRKRDCKAPSVIYPGLTVNGPETSSVAGEAAPDIAKQRIRNALWLFQILGSGLLDVTIS